MKKRRRAAVVELKIERSESGDKVTDKRDKQENRSGWVGLVHSALLPSTALLFTAPHRTRSYYY